MKSTLLLQSFCTLYIACSFLNTAAQDCTAPTGTITVSAPICQNDAVALTLAQATGQAPYNLVVNGITYTNVIAGQPFATFSLNTGETSIWGETGNPENPNGIDDQPNGIEVGVKFRSSVDGFITGIRFYKGSDNDGVNNMHVGKLYTVSGQLLASALFNDETTSGWQEVHFDNPVAITAASTYIATYYSPSGYFAITPGGFNNAVTKGPLTALATGTDGPNGVFRYSGGFPDGGNNANYWVDVLFAPSKATSSYTLTSITDAAGCNNTGAALSVATVTYNPLPGGTVAPPAQLCEGNDIGLTFSASSGTAPFSLVINNQTYNEVTNGSSFSTGATATTPQPLSFWNNTIIGGAASDETRAVVLGVKFRTAVAGKITGIRFYKNATNTGTHTATLWLLNPDNTGTELTTATFTNETASGWQQVNFFTPVSVSANTTYVATYYAPNGHYAFTPDFFTNHTQINGPLTALSSGTDGGNGVYTYAADGDFPIYTFHNTNYWVDVVFTTGDAVPFHVTSITDANGCKVTGNGQWLSAPFSQCSVVPVTFVDFTGKVEGNNVHLDWTTQTEAANRGFEVQRSLNGNAWTVIGFVNGSGDNSTTLLHYSYIDKNVAPGRYMYRLRQIDLDGHGTYSNSIMVYIGGTDRYSLEQNYPNPVHGETAIRFTHPQTERVTLRLFDANGRLVKVLLNSLQEKGTHVIHLNGKTIRAGIYYYTIEAGNFTAVKKLTVQ